MFRDKFAFLNYLRQFEGQEVNIIVDKIRKERSIKENNYYWGVVIPLLGDEFGYTPEEMHELGPRLLADLLECDGWDVDFYGTSMPLRDLIGAVRERHPRFLGLSAALVMHLGSVRRTITSIREALGSQTPPIIVGGNAFRGGDELWKKVGADMYAADASSAVAALRSMRD